MCLASGRFVRAISGVGRSNGLTYSHKNRHLTANFAHAQSRRLWTDCNQILHVGLDGQCDHWCQVFWKSVKGFRGYRNPPPKRRFLYLMLITLKNSVSTTVLHSDYLQTLNKSLDPWPVSRTRRLFGTCLLFKVLWFIAEYSVQFAHTNVTFQ